MYDEKTGEPITNRKGKLARRGPTPCEDRVGCAKGHYDRPKYRTLTSQEEHLVSLFFAVKAGGDFLSVQEKRSGFTMLLFSCLERIYEAKKGQHAASLMAAQMITATRATK